MKKPIIGISCNYDYADVFKNTNDIAQFNPKWHFISESYMQAIEEAGGIPLLLPIYKFKAYVMYLSWNTDFECCYEWQLISRFGKRMSVTPYKT